MEQLTDYIIVFTIFSLIIYDVWVILKDGVKASISVRVYTWSLKYPIIPFAFGVLFGHLFWPVVSCI